MTFDFKERPVPFDDKEVLVAAWLVPSRGWVSVADAGTPVAWLAYDLMDAGVVEPSEVHTLVHRLFNGDQDDESDLRDGARLASLGYGECETEAMVEDPDAVLYRHMASQGCVLAYADHTTGPAYATLSREAYASEAGRVASDLASVPGMEGRTLVYVEAMPAGADEQATLGETELGDSR